jgi:light-regulated signal transduction histidine kinase (bacteriophytochrome)
MSDLIEGLLNLSRLARQSMKREPIDLTALAETTAEGLRQGNPDRCVEFAIHEDLKAWGDATLLRAVTENLIGNAWKFTAKRAQAHIEVGGAARENGNAVFFVSDNGAGFDMKYAGKLFGVFQRLHTQEDFQGTGVGLATVRRIIQRHGGRIWAEAVPEQGATFFFSLPT